MTAREKLIARALELSEAEAHETLRLIDMRTRDRTAGRHVDAWGDLEAQTRELAEQSEARLAAREGNESWR